MIIWFLKTVLFLKENKINLKEKCIQKIGIAVLLLLYLVFCLRREGILSFSGEINSIYIVGVIIIMFFCISASLLKRNKENTFCMMGAMVFALFTVIGNLSIYDIYGILGSFLSYVSWTILFYYFLDSCYWFLSNYKYFVEKEINDWWIWGIISFLLFIMVFTIVLLVFYPGVMAYDSLMQMHQVTGGTPYSNHHPWLHTMLIKGIYEFGLWLFDNTNKAFALYGLFSICLISSAFAIVISYLRKKGLKKRYLILIIGTYVFSPINQMYSITMWKDIPFGAFVLYFIVLLCIMKDNLDNEKANGIYYLLFVPVAFGVCFFRTNGLYVFYGMIPFLIWVFWKEKEKVIIAIGTVVILGLIYKGPVFEYYDVTEPDLIEALSIPAQQISAVIAYNGNITDEQKLLISQIVDYERVPEKYLSSEVCSDNIKNLVREKNNQEYIKEHVGEFAKLYLELLRDNKRICVKAFVMETYGYWYHQVHFPFLWATYVEENGIGIARDSKFPDQVEIAFREYLSISKKLWDQYSSVGLIIYMFFISLFIALQKRSKHLIAYLPCLGIWGTLIIATPVHADIRYAYAIYISVPLLMCLTSIEQKNIVKER